MVRDQPQPDETAPAPVIQISRQSVTGPAIGAEIDLVGARLGAASYRRGDAP